MRRYPARTRSNRCGLLTFKERIPGQKAGAKVSFQVLTRSDYVFMWTQTYTYKVEGGEDEEKPNPDLPDEN